MPPTTQSISKPVVEQKKDIFSLFSSEKVKNQLKQALPAHMTPDRMLRALFTSINKTPDLMNCTQDSLMQCFMDCSQLGLEPDGRNAYLIPYKDNKNGKVICTLIVGYQGLIDLAYRHPKVKSIRWNAVYEKDHFKYSDGLDATLEYVPCDDDNPGALTHAYAICDMEGGAKAWVVLNRRMVMKAKASSRGADSKYSPWNTHEEAMWGKTAIRQLAKRMPRSAELVQALDREDDGVIDIQAPTAPQSFLPDPIPQAIAPVDPPYEAPVEQPKPAEPQPQPVTPEPAPQPAAVPSDKLSLIKTELATVGVKEAQLLEWGSHSSRRLWSSKTKSLDDLAKINPERLEYVYNNLGAILDELCGIPQ